MRLGLHAVDEGVEQADGGARVLGAAETEAALRLHKYAQELTGMDAYCFQAFADALELIPYTLAENAGMKPIDVVTELRKQHAPKLTRFECS